jgi:methionyl aminopeptidase
MIDLKSAEDVSRMRAACAAAARVLHDLSTLVVPGISTAGLDSAARGLMARYGCESACHGYVVGRLSYPGYVCISLNDEIVHGIGAADRIMGSSGITPVRSWSEPSTLRPVNFA